MKNKKNRKKALAIGTIVATLLLVAAGTYAFSAYTQWVKNHFQSSGMEEGKVVIVDIFDPPHVTPGQSISKKVGVQNTGAGKYIVRVSFEEVSKRLQDSALVEESTTPGDPAVNWPVILDSSQFATKYEDAVAKFTIGTDAATAVENPTDTFLFPLKGNDKEAMLARKVTINENQLPSTFSPSTITDTSGKYLAKGFGTADVYQKITIGKGSITKNSATGTYNVSTELLYNQFNTSYAANPLDDEGNWAGAPVFTDATKGKDAKSTPTVSADPTVFTSTSVVDKEVTLHYAKDAVVVGLPATATPGTDKWAYNDADGYFYYLDVLKDNAKTIDLLNEVSFGTSQANLLSSYDLYVGVEAIPASTDALKFAAKNGGGDIDKKTDADGKVDGSKTTWTEKNSAGWGFEGKETDPVYVYFASLIGQTI